MNGLPNLLEHENAVNNGAESAIGGELVRAFAREGALD